MTHLSAYGHREAEMNGMAIHAREPALADLRTFCIAIDLGSLGKAARVMHVSQPALSKRLRSLETWAGVRLLVRSHRGVAPTAAGMRLYPAARRLLADDDALADLIDRLHG